MSRTDDLEHSIRESYQLVREYEQIRMDAADPMERHRAGRIISEQWKLVKGYLSEYMPLCERLHQRMPQDIIEIAITAGFDGPPAPPDGLPQTDLPKLRHFLNDYFDEGELRTLCFDMGIDYASLPGAGKGDKARELVAYCERHGRTLELVQHFRQLRPKVSF